MGLQGPRGSRGRPTGSQGVKRWAFWVPGGQRVGLQGVKRAKRVPRGLRGTITKSNGVKGYPIGSQEVNV